MTAASSLGLNAPSRVSCESASTGDVFSASKSFVASCHASPPTIAYHLRAATRRCRLASSIALQTTGGHSLRSRKLLVAIGRNESAVAFAKLTSKEDMDAQGIGVMLLADIQQLFGEAKADRIFSRDLVQALCTRSDRPWSEANRGKPITETWLAIRLRAFRVHSKDLRIGKDHAKGYETADFNESFERYLPSDCVSKRDNVTMPINTGRDPISERDNAEDCHGLKSPDAPENNELSRCHGSNAASIASVPFMITRQMEADLRRLGHSQHEIDGMTPGDAHVVLTRAHAKED